MIYRSLAALLMIPALAWAQDAPPPDDPPETAEEDAAPILRDLELIDAEAQSEAIRLLERSRHLELKSGPCRMALDVPISEAQREITASAKARIRMARTWTPSGSKRQRSSEIWVSFRRARILNGRRMRRWKAPWISLSRSVKKRSMI